MIFSYQVFLGWSPINLIFLYSIGAYSRHYY